MIEQEKTISRKDQFIFYVKSRGLMMKRAAVNIVKPVLRYPKVSSFDEGLLLGESTTQLWRDENPLERDLTAGKIQNLRIACRQIDGTVVEGDGVFSFWKHLGKTLKRKGYVEGREVREGCIIPTIGGGICQLSNALYDVALKSGFDIIERHGHTEVVPGSLAEINRDATVFWNYVDLRFKSKYPFQIKIELSKTDLIVRFYGKREKISDEKVVRQTPSKAGNCYSCGVTSCPKNVTIKETDIKYGKTAFCLDVSQSELDGYVNSVYQKGDYILNVVNGSKTGKKAYTWSIQKGNKTSTFNWRAFMRSRAVKKTKTGGSLQAILFQEDERIAQRMANEIPFDASHIVVSQNLLVHFYKLGVLGGRTYDVLMERHAYMDIQAKLDDAFDKHPNSSTLKDFRVDNNQARLEAAALKGANNLVTNHLEINQLWPNSKYISRVIKTGDMKSETIKTIVFGGPLLARKGIIEFTQAVRGMNVTLIAPQGVAESDIIKSQFSQLGQNWLEVADLVVLPAYIEHKSTMLIKAIENGIPVIVSSACGLESNDLITVLNDISPEAIKSAIDAHIVKLKSVG